jgi:transposase
LERAIARESNYDPRQVAKGLGETTLVSLQREAIDWKRFGNRKAIGSYIGCCPCEFSTGPNQKLGSIDRMGNRRMRTLLVEAVWRLKRWNPAWRGFKKFGHVFWFPRHGPRSYPQKSCGSLCSPACDRSLATPNRTGQSQGSGPQTSPSQIKD